jgi:hypothetical protein
LISLPRHVVSRGHPEPIEFTGFPGGLNENTDPFRVVCHELTFLAVPQLSHSQNADLQKAAALNQQRVKLYHQGRYPEAIQIAKADCAKVAGALPGNTVP